MVNFKVAIIEMYPRIPWELVADLFGSAKRTLRTAALGVSQPVGSVTRHKVLITGYRSLSIFTYNDTGQTFWFRFRLGAHEYLRPLTPKGSFPRLIL
jgi:hypothetical protein